MSLRAGRLANMSEEQTEKQAEKKYSNISIQKKEHSEIEIKGEISASVIPSYRTKALKRFGKNMTIAGFRKGHIPEKILIEKVGEDTLMNEVAEQALGDIYPQIVTDNKLEVIGKPEVTITKLAVGNPIEFTIKTAVLPEIILPDYSSIAELVMEEEDDDLEVTNIDIDRVLLEVRRGKARFEQAQVNATKDSALEKDKETPEENKQKSPKQIKDEDLPELDDAFIKTLGNFSSLEDFKVKVKGDLKKDKEMKAKEKKRITLSEKIIEKTKIDLPVILIEGELQKMLAQMKDDISKVNIKFEDYLTRIKKTEENLKTEWKEQAEKRAKLQLILNAIAQKENITAEHNEVHKQMDHILAQFKDANPDNVHTFIETQLINEKVFKLLEKPLEK